MRVCHCNELTDCTIKKTITENIDAVSGAPDLLNAVGLVHRETMRAENKTPKPYSCTTCFNLIAGYVQEAGHFPGETIPERTLCAACPRRACLFIPA